MQWADVYGFPGAGKSTLCDPIWKPHDIPIENNLPPMDWQPFMNEVGRLFHVIRKHPTLEAAIRMNNRSMRKMATVLAMPQEPFGPKGYIQTGFVQRGLGFGWRMHELGIPMSELKPFFYLMPRPACAVYMMCPIDVAIQRNIDRGKVKATAHEVRDHIVRAMPPAIGLANEVLRDRGIPILEVSTVEDVSEARRKLNDFTDEIFAQHPAFGRYCQDEVCETPYWWW